MTCKCVLLHFFFLFFFFLSLSLSVCVCVCACLGHSGTLADPSHPLWDTQMMKTRRLFFFIGLARPMFFIFEILEIQCLQ